MVLPLMVIPGVARLTVVAIQRNQVAAQPRQAPLSSPSLRGSRPLSSSWTYGTPVDPARLFFNYKPNISNNCLNLCIYENMQFYPTGGEQKCAYNCLQLLILMMVFVQTRLIAARLDVKILPLVLFLLAHLNKLLSLA